MYVANLRCSRVRVAAVISAWRCAPLHVLLRERHVAPGTAPPWREWALPGPIRGTRPRNRSSGPQNPDIRSSRMVRPSTARSGTWNPDIRGSQDGPAVPRRSGTLEPRYTQLTRVGRPVRQRAHRRARRRRGGLGVSDPRPEPRYTQLKRGSLWAIWEGTNTARRR